MCGIVGYTGHRQAMPIILDGLSRIEYRGYDSAGIAVLGPSGIFETNKAVGKLDALRAGLEGAFIGGTLGLGHTRWATHGAPSLSNAHPHRDCTGRVSVVQNGIIENYVSLAAELSARGHTFTSQTDSEVLPHLIEEALDRGMDLEGAVNSVLPEMAGALVYLVACAQQPETIVAVRTGNAGGLVIGIGEGETYAASDLPAIVPLTNKALPLNNGEVAVLTPDAVRVSTVDGDPVERQPIEVTRDPVRAAKGMYKHFMQKEIMEQPQALTDALRGRVDLESGLLHPDYEDALTDKLVAARRVIFTGCGSSYYAALIGQRFFESLTGLTVVAEIASEARVSDREILSSPSRSRERRWIHSQRWSLQGETAPDESPSPTPSTARRRALRTSQWTCAPGLRWAWPQPRVSRRPSCACTCWRLTRRQPEKNSPRMT